MDSTLSGSRWPQRLLQALDTFTLFTGKSIAWLTLVMVLATCVVVILRRGFDIGSIALQESVTYMHAAVFLLGMAYALKRGAHVRVDIFYRRFNAHQKAWIDSLGCLLFLLPLAIFTGLISWDFVLGSWAIREGSTDAGGVGAVYLLKALIPLMAITLVLQACAELLRNLLLLMGITPATETARDGAL
jgi:TRAP-type mannitol/chloroaromatic compound transport system permease small subunit